VNISVCIATYRRADRLQALLGDLSEQERPPFEIVVVDNDASGSARAVVERERRRRLPYRILYAVQPEQNISLTRNRSVELASGDWLAFIDDDERAPAKWLTQLSEAANWYTADGVLGPVVPIVADNAPRWIRRGRFYHWPRMRSGESVPGNRLRFGNVLLRAKLLACAAPFDPAYGLTGGEDGDLLTRLTNGGAQIVWCDEAIVHEPVESGRLSLRWLLRRALRGGQDFARHTLAGRYGPMTALRRAIFVTRAGMQLLVAAVLMLPSCMLGRHRAVYWLLKAAANTGKLSVFWGCHYREYARPPDAAASQRAGVSA